MNKHTQWILTMIVVLSLAGLACNALSGGGGEIPAATESAPVESTSPDEATTQAGETAPAEPTAASTTGETSGGQEMTAGSGGLADLLNLDASNNFGAPTDLNSYRISFDLTYEGTDANGAPVSGRLTAEGAQVREPAASIFTFSMEGEADTAGNLFTFMQIGDTNYMIMPQMGCISTSQAGGEENPFDALMASGGMMGAVEGAWRVGEEEVNGVDTTVYEFDNTAFRMVDADYGVWGEVDGKINVAQDGGYVVRVVMDAQGSGTFFSSAAAEEGSIHYELNYFDFNEPIEITLPAECVTTAADKYPTLEDAFEASTMGGFYFYKTNHTFDEVVAFYKTEMVAAGWTLGEETVFAPAAFLNFTKDGETVQVSIAADQSSGATTVTIMEQMP